MCVCVCVCDVVDSEQPCQVACLDCCVCVLLLTVINHARLPVLIVVCVCVCLVVDSEPTMLGFLS